MKPIITVLNSYIKKEEEDGLLCDGLKILLDQLSGQNTENINVVVTSSKEGFSKTDASSLPVSSPTARTTKLTKPAKVLSWTHDKTLKTFIKQLKTWTEINKNVPVYVKYQDLMESLKLNKEIKGLPRFLGEHLLSFLEKKTYQTAKKALELLEV